MDFSAEALAKLAHISDTEVRQDIADTESEIRQLEGQIKMLHLRIQERVAFIDRLTDLLAARQAQNG